MGGWGRFIGNDPCQRKFWAVFARGGLGGLLEQEIFLLEQESNLGILARARIGRRPRPDWPQPKTGPSRHPSLRPRPDSPEPEPSASPQPYWSQSSGACSSSKTSLFGFFSSLLVTSWNWNSGEHVYIQNLIKSWRIQFLSTKYISKKEYKLSW